MKLYKFRSNYKFIKEELQEEYLYFAEPTELNDPLEGFYKTVLERRFGFMEKSA